MATIFIHHHADDVFAAEILAGAMVSLCRVALVAYPAGAQRMLTVAHGEMAENIILWTQAADADDAMQRLVLGFEVRRAHFILLTHGAEPPDRLGVGVAAPFYDRKTPWPAYRDAMRNLVIGRISPFIEAPSPRAAPRLPDFGIASFASGFMFDRSYPLMSVIVLAAITLWALLR